jgi:tRNA threonylcarbamoyladenosine biosynthesis protein TsaE
MLGLGRTIGSAMRPGEATLLEGALGAGKTTLARGMIEAWLGRPEEAPSPTYTLVEVYEGARGALAHADLYRLDRQEDVDELGLAEMLGEGALVIEWPDRLGAWRPRNRLEVRIDFLPEGRLLTIAGFGDWARPRARGVPP